jgi:hypothetical protein
VPIPIEYITIAVYDDDGWKWMHLGDFEQGLHRPYVPDLPSHQGNVEFDMNRAVREAIFRTAGIDLADDE